MAGRTRVKIEWNRGAFGEIRTMPGVMKELDGLAARMAAAAGRGYLAKPAKPTGGRRRGRAAVLTADFDSVRDNAKNGTLARVATTVKKS